MNQQYSYPDEPGTGYGPTPQPGYDPAPTPGYDPTSSMPVMGTPPPPQQQPGYGPPPSPGGMPPPMPKKSNTGLVLGLLIGLIVVVLLAGAGVWFFLMGGMGDSGPGGSDSADGKHDVFPSSYEPTEEAPPDGKTWAMSKPESYDKCVDLNLTGVESVIPFEGNPEGETVPRDDDTGTVRCTATMAGESIGNRRPTGSFYVDFVAVKDSSKAREDYSKIWDTATEYVGSRKADLGEEAEARTKYTENAVDVAVAYRTGNVSGLARISVEHGTEFKEPDTDMLINVLIDVVNSGLNGG